MSGVVTQVKGTRAFAAVRAAKARLERLAFERGDLEDTGGKVELEELGLEDPERTGYEPSSWGFLRRALRHLEVEPTDVFLDLGSGKGRVVWQAAQQPFARVIGVEISPELNAVAERNIERNRDRLACGEVELVTADAAFYEVPDDATFVYLFSPFRGRTFRRATANLIASLDRNPREMSLIYANPVMDEHLRATGRFDRTHALSSPRPDAGITSAVNLYAARLAAFVAVVLPSWEALPSYA
jgi:SAM-dependent methyltransferase